ncbi:MAG TPA: NifB/NifX family molybdenum-iron cluster-binding protein [Spirochaetota bacterium]|nr:NifB/NifX family molybdenum-iron cluster-binding protein [Spirochaetota bacterium]HNT13196.1 NifB/NifX family molybdenum-iron cluster-binding protein [Spirochaetota bacterium]HNV46697.1 NifB/NifX family molybdenum-iron cluster-binding protein [Spirochaetota bacterium]HPU88963.1 NifB/NifX family molybdenum-iron cluster-binding protein [Spirochaetota bacterium]
MKIAITSTGTDTQSLVDERFGRAKGFIVHDMESGASEYIDNAQNMDSPQGAGIQAAKTVINAGVSALITGHVGPKAHAALIAAHVDMFTGASGTVDQAIQDFQDGKLTQASQATVEGHW